MSRIIQTAIEVVELPLSTPFHTSLRSAYSVTDIRVIIGTDDGILGVGSASPTAKITGETTQSITAALSDFVLPAIQAPDLDLEDEITVFEAIQKSVVLNNGAKAAVDIALHDLCAKRRAVSLAQYLNRRDLSELETDVTVSLNTPSAMEKQALEWVRAGFSSLKIKLGGRDDRDIERVQRIREALGTEMVLRVDANQAWSVKESLETIDKLAALGVEFVEQPVYRKDLLGLREVTRHSVLPIAADESIFDAYDLNHVLYLQAANIINLKLMKTGGLYPAIKMIETIKEAGLDWMVGSMMEGPASVTAAAALSAAFDSRYKDLDAAYFLGSQQARGGPEYRDGKLMFPGGTGLGVSFADVPN
ncbi:phosphopyruvate hydratase [Acididesulfobacillus acetoxydans]|uniref:Dipeptide epimerase n=1 Tax=Acididesulfobacillus acetoxydans TaxID=1561005 RepID=A0A8S0XYP6_9FIRM|nr:dipeptide epimerase [Acididesulfobacillus acetoxydans]CAA7602257.1 phosphopyruvate hydratase [Acididesulfobacillus acetoxydans]CEJ07525.1 L-Ala-D/L-Glu epimerase [Acididesulfobacillus acetoxydans]